jgi:hypothetical protein
MALHPLLLPILATELATERGRYMIHDCEKEAADIENKTGQNPYDRKQVDLQNSQLPGLRLDAISIICKCGIHLASTKSRLLCLEQSRQLFDQEPCSTLSTSGCKQFREASSQLKDFIGYLESKNKNLVTKVQLVQQQAETQLAVVGTQPPQPEE